MSRQFRTGREEESYRRSMMIPAKSGPVKTPATLISRPLLMAELFTLTELQRGVKSSRLM